MHYVHDYTFIHVGRTAREPLSDARQNFGRNEAKQTYFNQGELS